MSVKPEQSSQKSPQPSVNISSQPEFVAGIQQWVRIDGQLKDINDKTKILREQKRILTSGLTNYIDSNVSNQKIRISDGELRVVTKKEYQPLTFNYIEQCLAVLINDPEQIKYAIDYMKQHRETTTTMDIKRTFNKT
jgi:ubiquinone/menaquinone biosynthesis C-methylase UbiE